MPDRALIEVAGAWKSFGSFTAVQDMALTVRPGEIVGLLGANGAGKTTLIRMILGLEAPNRGEIRIFGESPSRATRLRLGYMPQGMGLYRDLTVDQNIAFVASAFGIDFLPPLPDALAAVRDHLAGAIGLGRQRQLAFHCTLLHHPELLVLDEPTSGVDPLARARLWDTIHDQRDAGVGVLVTTHYMEEAEECSRLAIMSRGRLVAQGSEQEITAQTTAIEVETPVWADAFGALSAAGLPVTLAGRTVRVAGTDPATVETAIATAGLHARIRPVPATLEETMVVIERTHPASL